MTSAGANRPPMSLEGVDHALRVRREERDRISADLLDLEAHTTFQMLNSTALRGETGRRWSGAQEMAAVWSLYSAYRSTVEQAEHLRARSRRPGVTVLAELTALLAGRSVRADEPPRPVEQRSLHAGELVTLDEAVSRMDAAFRAVAGTVADVDAVWSVLLPRLAETEAALREAHDLQRALAEPAGADLAGLGRTLERARTAVTADPLGATWAGAELDRVAADLDACRADLDRALALRERYAQRRGAAAARIEALRAAEAEAGRTRERVARKIAAPLPDHQAQAGALAAALEALDAPGGRWLERAGELARLEHAAGEATDRARAVTQGLLALLDERDELRGRLRSFQAKAVRLSRAEDPAVTQRYERARDLLAAAPCDLREAAAAVTAYRHAIQERGKPPARGAWSEERSDEGRQPHPAPAASERFCEGGSE